MCGFTGFIDFTSATALETINSMVDCLHHRGPDDRGVEIFQKEGFKVGFGFRRLSIIDLSALGHQPMFSADRSIVVMLNGEIYNYREIRKELQEDGFVFKSGSDTEVVIYSYRKWGMNMVDRFIGMFAISLYDIHENCIYLIRDRAGVKPLFYHRSNDLILFGSELKAFHQHPSFKKEIDTNSLALYFQNGSIPAPYSIFKNTFKLRPGHWLKFNLADHSLNEVEYWNPFDAYNAPGLKLDYKEAMEQTEALLQSACDYRMVADVPVGVFLSGGYDSTAVTALLTKSQSSLNTYTIGFEDSGYNESEHARAVAEHLGTQHHEYICRVEDAQKIVYELADIYDEPFGDSSAIPTTLVSRIARQHVTVALSADAGDELFAGYPRHIKARNYLSKLDAIPSYALKFASIANPLLNNLPAAIHTSSVTGKLAALLTSNGLISAFNVINQTFTSSEINKILKNKFSIPHTLFDEDYALRKDLKPLSRVLAIEYATYLVDDILQKVDRATMSASLEGREPFLDHRLLEFVARLPEQYKLDGNVGKKILKDIVHQYVPKQIMDRPKMGFGVPVASWLRTDLRKLFIEVMDEAVIAQQGVLNVKEVRNLKKAFLEGSINDTERMWYLFSFQLWYNRWMN